RSHPRRRLDIARPPAGRRNTRLLPAQLPGVRPRGRSMCNARLRRHDQADRAIRPLHVPVPDMSGQTPERKFMTVSIEKNGAVWTIVHDRPEARNAMDPTSAEAICDPVNAFARDGTASAAVSWGRGGACCAGWDLRYGASLVGKDPLAALECPDDRAAPAPRGPMGPTRMQLSK